MKNKLLVEFPISDVFKNNTYANVHELLEYIEDAILEKVYFHQDSTKYKSYEYRISLNETEWGAFSPIFGLYGILKDVPKDKRVENLNKQAKKLGFKLSPIDYGDV